MSKRIEVKYCIRCGSAVERQARYGQVRPVCPSCGWIHFSDPKVAAAVLVEEQGKILLVQRGCNPYRGLWTLPAGFVNAAEAPDTAARRECLEETGLNVRITRILDIRSGREHEGGADFVIVYQAVVESGVLSAADDADAAAWFSRDALPELAFEATKYILKNF